MDELLKQVETAIIAENCNHHQGCKNCGFLQGGRCIWVKLKQAINEHDMSTI